LVLGDWEKKVAESNLVYLAFSAPFSFTLRKIYLTSRILAGRYFKGITKRLRPYYHIKQTIAAAYAKISQIEQSTQI
jgi:hypothetical protein